MKKNFLLLFTIFTIITSCANDKKDYLITIHTTFGDMKVILYDETPLHKANFIALAESGQYDSTIFHRIIKEFMVQGGGIDMKNNDMSKKTVPAEIVPGFFHHKGALAAARQGDQINPEKASSWCQFYIVQGKVYTIEELTSYQEQMNQGRKNQKFGELIRAPENADILSAAQGYQREMQSAKDAQTMQSNKDALDSIMQLMMTKVDAVFEEKNLSAGQQELYTTQGGSPHLDGDYTVFGRVVEGMGVIDQLAAVKTGPANKPVEDLFLTMEVEMVPKKEITKLYGYNYPEVKE